MKQTEVKTSSIDDEALYHSPEAEKIKAQICDIGRRLWQREYVDGNGGNISARLGNRFLCTPTGVSKGFLTPDMISLVDDQGNQLAGTWKRTSEFTTHLAIFHNVPAAQSVCHAHPVHATAFAVAGLVPPERLISEIEIFVGRVALTPYATPGAKAMYDVIAPLAEKHQSILMGNHGVITWGTGVEDAYFKMEITDSFCRTVAIASQLPNNRASIPGEEMIKLFRIKQGLGLPDVRFGATASELEAEDPWEKMESRTSTGFGGRVNPAEMEAIVRRVTEEVLKQLGEK